MMNGCSRMREIGNRHPGVLFQMAGVYPGSITASNWQYELDQVHPQHTKTRAYSPRPVAKSATRLIAKKDTFAKNEPL